MRGAAVWPATGLLDGDDVVEDLAEASRQERTAVDDHVDLVCPRGHGIRGVRELDPK